MNFVVVSSVSIKRVDCIYKTKIKQISSQYSPWSFSRIVALPSKLWNEMLSRIFRNKQTNKQKKKKKKKKKKKHTHIISMSNMRNSHISEPICHNNENAHGHRLHRYKQFWSSYSMLSSLGCLHLRAENDMANPIRHATLIERSINVDPTSWCCIVFYCIAINIKFLKCAIKAEELACRYHTISAHLLDIAHLLGCLFLLPLHYVVFDDVVMWRCAKLCHVHW